MKTIIILSMALGSCLPTPADPAPAPAATEIISECVELVPPPAVFDCPAWNPLYECLGATEAELRTLEWIRAHESMCGERLKSPTTSDTGDCQFNGVHGKKGWFEGKLFKRGWAVELLGLTPNTSKAAWRSNVDTPEGTAKIAAGCLMLLRSNGLEGLGVPDSFEGCSHWKVHPEIRSGFGCGVI